jgi:predicted component of type VI protein secretion system
MTKEQIDYLITGMFMQACSNRKASLYLAQDRSYRKRFQFQCQYTTRHDQQLADASHVALQHLRQLESSQDLSMWTYTAANVARREYSKGIQALATRILGTQ